MRTNTRVSNKLRWWIRTPVSYKDVPVISTVRLRTEHPMPGKSPDKYSHRILKGIGHNVPEEDPQAFAKAVVEVDGY